MLSSVFGLKGMAVGTAIAFVAGSVAGGWAVRVYYKSEIAESQARAAKVDSKAASELNESAGQTAREISDADANNEKVTRDVLQSMAQRDRCRLTGDGLRFLLDLK